MLLLYVEKSHPGLFKAVYLSFKVELGILLINMHDWLGGIYVIYDLLDLIEEENSKLDCTIGYH